MEGEKSDNSVKSCEPQRGTSCFTTAVAGVTGNNNGNIGGTAGTSTTFTNLEENSGKMATATNQFPITPSTKASLTSSPLASTFDAVMGCSPPSGSLELQSDGSPRKTVSSGIAPASPKLTITNSSPDELPTTTTTAAQMIANKQKMLQKENLRRVINPPKLERKHSSGDLHSRLKTRKILGVGETDNGDIHRSKISQVLGHNEHLYVKFPRGVWNWQAFLSALFLVQALLILFFPRQACQLKLLGIQQQHSEKDGLMMGSKYYAVSLLALSFILWKFMFIRDKGVARAVQLVALIHFSSLCVIDVVSAASTEISHLYDVTLLIVMGVRVILALICSMYLNRIGTATSGLRKSPSHKDLGESMKKEG